MKKIAKRAAALLFVLTLVMSMMVVPTSARGLSLEPSTTVKTTYSTPKVTKVRDIYGDWIRDANQVIYMASTDGELSSKTEEHSTTITNSWSLEVPLSKKLSLQFGQDVTFSKTTSTLSASAHPLKTGECTAFYYRKHWREYDVSYTVTTTKTTWKYGSMPKVTTSKENKTKRIKAEVYVPGDCTFIYSYDYNLLTPTISQYIPELGTMTVAANYCP